jgi:hypothetical protein
MTIRALLFPNNTNARTLAANVKPSSFVAATFKMYMKKPFRKTVLLSVILIVTLFLLSKIEYDSFSLKSITYPLLWVTVGIIGFRYFKNLPTRSAIRKTILSIGFAIYVLASLYFTMQLFLCAESTYGTRYINTKSNSLTLECRTYDCYGTADQCQLYKLRRLTNHIKWVTIFDDKIPDKNEWRYISLSSE